MVETNNILQTLNLPSTYANVISEREDSYNNLDDFKINWNPIDNYRVVHKIGRGKYSEVFEGVNIENRERVCIKVLKPVRTMKILREVKILQNLYGGPNIIKLLDLARDEASRTPSLLRVIDWGLAEFYIPNQKYNVRVASRYYKGPELLVDDQKYHYSLDIWSAGCTFAEIIFKKDPFFFGDDNQDQLIKIAKVMGTDPLLEYMKKYNLSINQYFSQKLDRYTPKSLNTFVNNENKHLATDLAIELLEKMLVYDKNLRITPKQALEHPYFYNIRFQNGNDSY
eukprot:403369773